MIPQDRGVDAMRHALAGARIFTGEEFLDGHAVLLEGGRILDLPPEGSLPPGLPVERLPAGSLLAPGFIDTQVNGGGGVLFNDSPTAEACLAIAAAHRRFGTTSLLPTFITDAPDRMAQAAAAAAEAAAIPGSGVIGVHLEGPFLAPARKGVHEEGFIRTPGEADIEALCALPARFAPGRVLVSLAPEMVTDAQIARLAAAGVVVAGAHSAAGFDRTLAAVRAGLRGFTHLFNAMPPLMSREPGIAGVALSTPDTFCGLIVDGVHVHPAILRLALAAKPAGTLFLVTDAMPPTGTDVTSFPLYGRTIHRRNGRLETQDGVLAGADIDMATAVRNCVTLLGLDLGEALRMASLYPARFLTLDDRLGRIAPGHVADLVLLDGEVRVLDTWVAGRRG
ncbi:N-acetylglucosamine-6-phosphate deacetylase [Indioceanicola profundi]|uniref:N-acetylglucosamine-6-phosphate deacetylase n=1 Tax=Indioceanicola profundi TaxID=2220096 RepID=UPI001CEDAE40|nr:N-acetylglucosamine-6-phosphate deacetylase [Indioceanicola profundi]